MEKLYENIKKELKEIEQNGISASNIDTASKLIKMMKELCEIKEKEGKHMRDYGNYRYDEYRNDYRDRDYMRRDYMGRDDYMNRGYDRDYGRRVPGPMIRYNGNDGRMRENVNRIVDGVEMYEYGKERYQHGDSEERIHEGLEKLMYAICMCVESMMDFAETPQEKEIIRKHIQKLRDM